MPPLGIKGLVPPFFAVRSSAKEDLKISMYLRPENYNAIMGEGPRGYVEEGSKGGRGIM